MPPKKPHELRKQIEAQNEGQASAGTERTAEGMEARTPSRGEFFGNLAKLVRPKRAPEGDGR